MDRSTTRWEVNLEEPLHLAVGGRTNPVAISSDGSRIVFAAERGGISQLFFRDVDDFDNQPIPGTEGARNPFFSPDGKRVGFFAGTWTRSQISLGHDTWLGGIWSSDTLAA